MFRRIVIGLQALSSYIGPRLLIAVLLIAFSVYCFNAASSYVKGFEPHALFLNMGSEILGIVVTVAFIDLYFAWRRRLRDARGLAWRVLYELDHTVWVWQGGYPTFNFDELCAIAKGIDSEDTLAPCTAEALVRLGNMADSSLSIEKKLAGTIPHLEQGLEVLRELTRFRAVNPEQPLNPQQVLQVKNILLEAIEHLGEAIGQRVTHPQAYNIQRNRTAEAQELRLYGATYHDRSLRAMGRLAG